MQTEVSVKINSSKSSGETRRSTVFSQSVAARKATYQKVTRAWRVGSHSSATLKRVRGQAAVSSSGSIHLEMDTIALFSLVRVLQGGAEVCPERLAHHFHADKFA